MQRLQHGFLLVEILISFLLITLCIGMCIRHQVAFQGWQAQALITMDVVNQLEAMLNEYGKGLQHRTDYNTLQKKIAVRETVTNVALPRVQGAPPNFTINTARIMRVACLSASWKGQSGEQQCCLPVVYKKGVYEH